ncbi:uncharacterized protein LOC121715727 [Alosa sapidissima]|uniref:uncharacterized protein LOC121715727 n=1 Tax=Alosa sapidissima TaxID=34773 RepID=UPI001C0A119C|nr:uncharacterized protein LOC121715727 [Alosa sapidissima]
MSSPAKQVKREGETVVGYLHALSPVKTSRQSVRYFECTIQTGHEEFNRVVCFSMEKRNDFVVAVDNKQAVKLVDTRKSVSYGNPGGYDVILSHGSRVEASDDLPFLRREPRSAGKMTVEEVLGLGPRQRVGVIEAKMLQATASRIVPVNGLPCELKSFEICDSTGQTALTVWERHILSVQEGRSYRFATLSTRKEEDRTVLTTTPSTVITAIAEVGQPASLRSVSARASQTVSGPVTGVQIVAKLRCQRCHASQENVAPRSPTHRCDRCGLLQRANSYTIFYSGVLVVIGGHGEERTMTLTNSSVFNYVRDNYLTCSAHDGRALEDQVMSLSELDVTVNEGGLVVRFGKQAEEVRGAAKETEPSDQGNAPDARTDSNVPEQLLAQDADPNALEQLMAQSKDFD